MYRQVHRWMTEDAVIIPQLRIAGEGDVVIARRPTPPQVLSPTMPTPASKRIPAQHLADPGTTPGGADVSGAAALAPTRSRH